MIRLALQIAVALSFLAAVPAHSGITGATADGTWDCRDDAGVVIGTVIIADKTYAFLQLNGRVGAYGKLFQVGQAQFDLPYFVVVDGHLKDELGVVGVGLTGPRDNEHDLSGELFLKLIFGDATTPFCRRRSTPVE